MKKSNVPIGTVIGFDGDGPSFTVEVKKATNGCKNCHFYFNCTNPPKRKVMPCFSFERTDGISVFYPDYKQEKQIVSENNNCKIIQHSKNAFYAEDPILDK